MKLNESYFCDLYLEQIDDLVKGILILAYYNHELLSIVKQPVEGKIDGTRLDFSGISYSFARKGASKNYNLDRFIVELSDSAEKIKGKVISSSSGTMELGFARQKPRSTSNILGLWDGIATWDDEQRDHWSLFLSEGNSSVKGTLIVTVIHDSKITHVVEQQVEGELSSDHSINFSGVSGKYIYSSKKTEYSFDSLNGLITDDGGTIKGNIMSGNSTGTVVLELVRKET